MNRGKVVGGVDIGGTKTAVVLSTSPPNILRRLAFPTEPANGPGQTVQQIIAGLRSATLRMRLRRRRSEVDRRELRKPAGFDEGDNSSATQFAHLGQCADHDNPGRGVSSSLLS